MRSNQVRARRDRRPATRPPETNEPKSSRQAGLRSPPVVLSGHARRKFSLSCGMRPSGIEPAVMPGKDAADPRNGPRKRARFSGQRCCGDPLEAKTHGRPVGKPPSRPVGRAIDAKRVINRLYGSFRKETPMLSGPRRTQARSHLPKIRPDTRCGQSRKRPTTGPCGELATHFMGLLVCAIFQISGFLEWKWSRLLAVFWKVFLFRRFWFCFSCRGCMGE